MTIAEQLIALRDTIQPVVKAERGQVFIAGDPYQLVTLLRESPGGIRVGILFNGEDKRGEYEERGAVDRTFWVVASRGQGLKLEPGANLVTGASGGKPLFDIIEAIRDAVRGMSFSSETTEVTPNFTGIELFNTEGYLMDAYRLTFSIGVQLPAIVETEGA